MTVLILNFSILLGLPQLLLRFGNISFGLKLKGKENTSIKIWFYDDKSTGFPVSLVRYVSLVMSEALGVGLAWSS